MTRDYDNSRRARRSAQTGIRILEAAEALVRANPIEDVTLNAIAELAGVTVQTVLRHHGSRDGVLTGMSRMIGVRIAQQREDVVPGDVEGAIDNLLAHYEAEGDLVLTLLSQESLSGFAADAVQRGRSYHRHWVTNAFGPLLSSEGRELEIDALVVATDLYTWRLLRRDLKKTIDDVRAVMLHLALSILARDAS